MEALKEFEALKIKFPTQCTQGVGNDNCDWTDNMKNSKNCYWSFDGAEILNGLYSYYDWQVKDSIDSQWSAKAERCYELTDSIDSSDCYFCGYVARCYNLEYCMNCTDCHDLFGCANLSNKSFCIDNIQYTEEEYLAKLPELKKIKPDESLAKVRKLLLSFPTIQSYFADNQNSDYTDYVYKSVNAYYCFDCNILEDCGYLSNANESKDSWDCNMVIGVEHCSESVDAFECYNCYQAQNSHRCFDSAFIYNCTDCHNCFMCANLDNAKHCILNVQYTPDEYTAKVAELKKSQNLGFSMPQSQA
jgi:hypothetical protein